MKTRSTTIIAAGVITAVLGAVLVLAYARSVEGKTSSGSTATAWVASTDIAAGTKWDDVAGSFEEKKVPADIRPASAVTSREQFQGRTAVRAIAAGEVISATQFGASDSAPAGGLEIPPGHNAITMSVATPQGVGRYVQSGDIINVFATFKGAQDTKGPATITKLILTNVQVLQNRSASDVASKTGAEPGGEVMLTVSVTPVDAERLIYAKENASLWFGLVRAGDGPAVTGGASAPSVIG